MGALLHAGSLWTTSPGESDKCPSCEGSGRLQGIEVGGVLQRPTTTARSTRRFTAASDLLQDSGYSALVLERLVRHVCRVADVDRACIFVRDRSDPRALIAVAVTDDDKRLDTQQIELLCEMSEMAAAALDHASSREDARQAVGAHVE